MNYGRLSGIMEYDTRRRNENDTVVLSPITLTFILNNCVIFPIILKSITIFKFNSDALCLAKAIDAFYLNAAGLSQLICTHFLWGQLFSCMVKLSISGLFDYL